MNRVALLDRVNRWTTRHYAMQVTSRQLDDWVREKLVPGPLLVPHPGRRAAQREWSTNSYRCILRICRSKSRGLTTFDQLRIDQWLNSNEPLTKLVRDSMADEFRRLYKQLYRLLRTDPGPANDCGPDNLLSRRPLKRPTAVKPEQIDARLQPFADQMPDEVWTHAYDAMRFGEVSSFKSFIDKINAMFNFDGNECGPIGFNIVGAGQIAEDNDAAIEGSCEHSIKYMDQESMIAARQIFRVNQNILRTVFADSDKNMQVADNIFDSFRTMSNSIKRYPWNFVFFTICIQMIPNLVYNAEITDD